MRFLIYNDLHLKPAASDYDIGAMSVPDDIDGALILGDLTHRAGPDDIALARQFVEQFGPDVPVVYVPGNHDHSPTEESVVESLPHAQSGHCAVHTFDDATVVGWGCEQRSLSPALDQRESEVLDLRNAPRGDRRYVADQTAGDIEAVCYEIICGSSSIAVGAESLGIKESEEVAFRHSIKTIKDEYDILADLLEGHENILLATHLSPFNTSFDRHHSTGTREEDKEGLHTGSIALKIAIREHDVFATLSGHSHTYGYDVGDGDDVRPYCLNLGLRGIGTVTVEPKQGRFAFTQTKTKEN
jgi:Icc-related predicted phosphoesterase